MQQDTVGHHNPTRLEAKGNQHVLPLGSLTFQGLSTGVGGIHSEPRSAHAGSNDGRGKGQGLQGKCLRESDAKSVPSEVE